MAAIGESLGCFRQPWTLWLPSLFSRRGRWLLFAPLELELTRGAPGNIGDAYVYLYVHSDIFHKICHRLKSHKKRLSKGAFAHLPLRTTPQMHPAKPPPRPAPRPAAPTAWPDTPQVPAPALPAADGRRHAAGGRNASLSRRQKPPNKTYVHKPSQGPPHSKHRVSGEEAAGGADVAAGARGRVVTTRPSCQAGMAC